MNQLRAGAGTGTIKFPKEMFPIEGFRGIHDEPHIRVLLLESGSRAAVISAELVMLPDSRIKEIQTEVGSICGIDPENVFVHLTHAITTPHDPMMMPPFARPENAEGLSKLHGEAVMSAVREAAEGALGDMRDAGMSLASGECFVNANRDIRTPFGWWISRGGDGEANRSMRVIKFEDTEHRPIAYILSYALKTCAVDNSQMEENKRLISPDAAGLCCELMQKELGAPVLFLMSAAANQVPRQTAWYDEVREDGTIETVDLGVEHGFKLVDELGREMAEAAIRTANSAAELPPARNLETASGSFLWRSMGRMKRGLRLEGEYPLEDRKALVPVQCLIVGDCAFIFGKSEMNPPTEAELLRRSPFPHTFLVTMTNGGFKYMPEAEAYDNFTWEAQSAPVAKGAAENFVHVAINLLNELKG